LSITEHYNHTNQHPPSNKLTIPCLNKKKDQSIYITKLKQQILTYKIKAIKPSSSNQEKKLTKKHYNKQNPNPQIEKQKGKKNTELPEEKRRQESQANQKGSSQEGQ